MHSVRPRRWPTPRDTTWSARTYQMLLPGDAAAPRAEYLFLWPNLLLCFAPDGLVLTHVLPESAGRSRLREIRYGLPDASRTMRLLRYAHERVRRQARRDDLRMLERAQSGAQSLAPDATGPLAAANSRCAGSSSVINQACRRRSLALS